jgi:hypothetical protein
MNQTEGNRTVNLMGFCYLSLRSSVESRPYLAKVVTPDLVGPTSREPSPMPIAYDMYCRKK